jgi:hypothetical protein
MTNSGFSIPFSGIGRISDPVPVDFGQSLCYHGNRRVILCLGAAPMQPAAT